jgi:chromate transporter
MRGAAGAIAAFVAFGLPAFVLMMVLSALYASTAEIPPVKALFLVLQAVVVALVAFATVSFGRASIKNWIHVFIAGIAAVLFIVGINPVLVIIVAALLGITIFPVPEKKQERPVSRLPLPERSFVLMFGGAIIFFLLLFFADPGLYTLATTMAVVDLFAFGGGFAALPLMFHQVVVVHSWLDNAAFINGLALGQVTPGPIVISATFVGYLTYGFWGGVIATIAIFIPSFLVVLGTVPYYDWLRGSGLYQKMFQGILLSFTGLLLSVTVRLALAVSWSVFPAVLAAGAFFSLLMGAEILWVVVAGIAITLIAYGIVH